MIGMRQLMLEGVLMASVAGSVAGAAVSPTSGEVERHVRNLAARYPRLISIEEAGRTDEGRPILAVAVTDPDTSADDRQHVLIIAGQHGNEESGRMVALALLDWLVTEEANALRARQRIVVMPNVNPDGADQNLHKTPRGVSPNLDHALTGAVSPEGKAVEKIAAALEPEVFVDMHARGGAGCSYGMVLYPRPRVYTEDDYLLHAIADEMARAGEQAGLPHVTHPLTWPGWGGDPSDEASTTLFAYRNFKSLVLLTEAPESDTFSPSAALRTRSGLATLKRLLAYGQTRHPFLRYDGYPCGLIGMRYAGVAAVGRTATERRRSRIALWKNADGFKSFRATLPEEATVKRLAFEYTGAPVPEGAGLQFRSNGRMAVDSVTLDGRTLAPSETDGYGTWQDECSTFVVVALPKLEPRTYHVEIRFQER
jgi:hypothetical protein